MQCCGDRCAQLVCKCTNLRGCIGTDYAAADIKKRPFCFIDHVSRFLDLFAVPFYNRIITAERNRFGIFKNRFRGKNIFRQVDKHGARTAGGGNIKCCLDGLCQIVDIFHEIIMFCNRTSNAHDIHFLECIVSDQLCYNLTCKHNKRYRIHIRIGNTCDSIGRTGAGCHQDNSGFSGCLGISFRCMGCTLFVPRENMFDVCKIMEYIIDADHDTAGISKESIDALLDKAPHKYLCACHQFPLMIVVCFRRCHCNIPSIV